MRTHLSRPLLSTLKTSLLRSISTSTVLRHPATLPPPPPPTYHPPHPHPRTRTPTEKQFESWITNLKPGFTPPDVDQALKSQQDPDLALDIFRWTAHQRNYKHNDVTYLTMITIAVAGKRFHIVETLVEEVLAGACPPSLPLYNCMIKFCVCHKFLFNRAFDTYKKMLKSENAKPSLETYAMLFNAILRKFNQLSTCYVYLHSVRSLAKQMRVAGVIPDTYVLNMIIKAYSKCLEVNEAIKIFREMGLYGCEPNAYTYSYITRGLCEKGRVDEALEFYKEMKEKKLVPKGSCYMILICSLALERKFEDGTEVLFDMLRNGMQPDLLTYKTLLEEICRDGKGDEAFELLEEVRKFDRYMNERMYSTLLNGLHFINRE